MAYWAAYFLPALELVCGVGVLIPKLRKEAAFLIVVMMLVFIVAIISAWVRGLDISCGCFGGSEATANYPWLIFRDIVFMALCAPLIFEGKPSRNSNTWK